MTELVRFGIIGDIHLEETLLEKVTHCLCETVPKIISTGDIADYGEGSFDRCCSLLREAGIDTVRGNHDRWLLEDTMRSIRAASDLSDLSEQNRLWYSELPAVREYRTGMGPLLLCHGLPAKDMSKINPDDFGYAIESNDELQELIRARYFRFVVNGHSHRPMVRGFGKLTIINAGALKTEENQGFFLIVDIKERTVEWYHMQLDTDSPLLAETLQL
jgi:predicted phosphodiesterase